MEALPTPGPPTPIGLIDDADTAAALCKPLRPEILALLGEPGSATTLARQLGLPRQKVNYHLRELERAGLVEPVAERRRGNCVERLVRARAERFVITPEALGAVGAGGPADRGDRFSWTTLAGLLARALRELGGLWRRAGATGKRIPTLSLDAEIRFARPADFDSFAAEAAAALAAIAAHYHDEESPHGRRFRVLLGAHPALVPRGSDADPDDRPPGDQPS